MADVLYYINGNLFSSYGVYVSASSGIVSKLEMKDPLSADWSNYHGTVIDLHKPVYKSRNITLDCFIEANGYDDFVTKFNSFMANFVGKYTQRLKISVGSKLLVYEVYCPKTVDIDKKWNENYMVGTFRLNLIEPEPVKKVLQGSGTVNITLTSSKMLNIYWGDGTHTFDVSGNGVSVSHALSGSSEIIITGVIEDITSFSSNCTVLWDKLQ